jgi:TonB-linked SusC/RagA family outer membrane protein
MKITFSQILIAIILSGFAYSSPLKAQDVLNQTVNISLSNAKLLDVINYLQKNNNVKFIYSKNAIDVSKTVAVNFENKALKTVLDQVFKNNGITYEVLKDRIVLEKASDIPVTTGNDAVQVETKGTGAIQAVASIHIIGKVTDEAGEPIIGASVQEKGTTNGISTDINGSFALNVSNEQAVLVIKYIGYTTKEVPVGTQINLTIVLSDAVKGLNEVVVVGYGTQSRATVTGAISTVKDADLDDQQVTRADDALQGRVSGVNVVQSSGAPGSTPAVSIRGITTLATSYNPNASNPLYVIDGVIVDNGGMDNINPNDIATIDVLKDASAAIYGARSANGVVIITTKKGKNGPAKISYNGYVGFQEPVSKVQLTDASQYAMLRNESVTNSGGVAPFTNPSAFGTGTNWQNEIFTNSMIQNHNLSISGANDNANYYTSFGYLDQQGVVDPSISNYKKFTFTTNNSFKLKKWLTVGENFTYAYTHTQSSLNTNSVFGGPLSSALNLDPLTPAVVTDINAQPNANIYNQYAGLIIRNAQGLPYGISNYVGQEITNPLAYAQSVAGNYNYATNLMGNAFVEIAPIKGLKIRSQISAKQAYWGTDSFTPLYYLNGSSNNLSNTSQYLDYEKNLSWNLDNTATYTRSFGKNNFTALLGQSAQEESGSGLNGTFIGEPVNTFNQASPNYSLPTANKMANGYDSQTTTLASTFARLSYDYDQKYLLSGIIRRDGSSKFGSNNIYGTFPSIQAGYIVSKEDWFPKNSFVDFLKVRASYGVVGNEMALNTFQYTPLMNSGNNYVFGYPGTLSTGYSPAAPANPNLQWEQTKTTDIGVDATLLHNLSVTVDVYKKLTSGMLEQLQLPAYAGFGGQPWANVGNMENKGIELELTYKNKVGDFNYSVSGNISYNHNQVTYLGTDIHYLTVGTVQSANYEIGRDAVGQPVGEFYGFKELGTFKSQAEINAYKNSAGQLIQPNAKPGDFKWADLNGDGKIDANDRQYLGNPNPPFTYGLNFNANYHNFDVKIFGQGVWGNKIYQAYRRLDIPTANYPIAALQAWTPSNPSSNYPRLTDNDTNNNFTNPSNFYLQNGAYFRIKTLQLGYTLPSAWVKAADVQRVRVFMSSNNLLTITGYKGYDPEINGGIDMGIYPQARTFMVGLDVAL